MGLRRFSVALGLAASVAACGGIIDPAKNTIEPFSGTLQVGGTNSNHNYTLGKNGEVEVTVTSVVPTPTNGSIALGLGQVLSGSCSLLGQAYISVGVVNRKVQFGVLNKGTYCLVVFDPGVLTVPVNYAGNFSHP
jgi:hypothetical protein